MIEWLFSTLRAYPEIAIFLSLGLGYFFGKFSFRGIGLGSVTATLLCAILIGQIGITVSPNVKSIFFLIFLFAVGYGVEPQFVRGIAKDGLPQALFAVVMCVLCLGVAYTIAKMLGYDLGAAAGMYAGSQTISASMGLATDAINRAGLPAEQSKAMLDVMPVAYTVTYIFGTIGSALVIALLGPVLLRIDLVGACKKYVEEQSGGDKAMGGAGSAWHRWELRAFRIEGGKVAGIKAGDAEALSTGARLFVLRVRRGDQIEDANTDTVLQAGDVIALAGTREALVQLGEKGADEVDDSKLLNVPVEGVDVLLSNKEHDGKTLAELAQGPHARGVFLSRITRGATATQIPVLPKTTVHRGDILTLVGRTQDTAAAAKELGVVDRPSDITDVATVGIAIVIGALVGAIVIKVAGVPLTLSTAGGVLIAGLVFGWLRSVRPSFGRIPTSTVWFMNSVGLNVFIAVVGISSGPGFVKGLQMLGVELFLWGAVATTVPLLLGLFIGKFLFRFPDALLLGIVAGARTTTAALGLVCDMAKSQVPALGYTVTYAVSNTLLTIWGMVMIMLLSLIQLTEDRSMDVSKLRTFETLSPFEIKDELIKLAKSATAGNQSTFLNAGRGNPNWIATEPREGFFLLGQFAVTESKRVMEHPAGLGGMPAAPGIAARLDAWLAKNKDMPGASFLARAVPFAVKTLGFERDAFVHELVDSIIGDNYPVPDRMLVHNERIVHEYLQWAMCGDPRPKGKFDLYAVEGGTAAMCYLFKSLKANRLLLPGDRIALGTPIFTPYLEMTHLEDYALDVIKMSAEREDKFQFTAADLKKLEDKKLKALFLVNPGNPSGVALSKETIAALAKLVKTKRPDLMLLTDDVYGTFVPGFRSLLGELPHNTIGVYSYSKYFGCTGWRLGVIAVHEDNIFDKMLQKRSKAELKALDKRYGALTLEPRKVKFIDRIVADSRDVALNHTAGLSLPQQVMMSLFSLAELMDRDKTYQKACRDIVQRRVKLLLNGLGLDVNPTPEYDGYYGLIDFEYWARQNLGEDAVAWLKKNVHPLDLAFQLAEKHGIVLLNGGGFDAPGWSMRVSLANLPDSAYEDIGKGVRAIAKGYRDRFEASKSGDTRAQKSGKKAAKKGGKKS